MTWTKLSDDFPDDCWTLSDAAFRLHVEGLAWSNRKLLDLRLPKDNLSRWAKHPEAVDELVANGYWTDEDDHLRDMIEQFLLTDPGERVNRPDFGAGLRHMIFEPNSVRPYF